MPDPESTKDSFASLYEQSAKGTRRARIVKVGQRLEVTVSTVTRDAVFVDLDEKREAWLDPAEFLGPDGKLTLKVGDKLTAHVLEMDARSGSVRLGKSLGKNNGAMALELARAEGIPVEGKVTGINKGGAEVDIDGVRAFCPVSQLDNRFVQDSQSYVGKTFRFRVTEIREGGRNVVLSRRAVLEVDAREALERMLKTLAPGSIVKATVSGVRDFGAFVDLGDGVEGLVPASELSHDTRVRPSDVVTVGEVLDVQIKEIRPQDDGTTRVTLSLKALATDPWQALHLVAPLGKVLAGHVTRLADFGAFVRVAAGVEGLLHVSELGSKIEHPSKVLTVGQSVMVVARSAEPEARKLSLTLAPEGTTVGGTAPQPTALVHGAIVKAKVERIETYGVFVQVEGTRGRAWRRLIPNAELGFARGADVRKLVAEGTELTAKVLETGEGRLRLSVRAVRDDEERANFEGYRESVRAPSKMGTLGDLLKKAKR